MEPTKYTVLAETGLVVGEDTYAKGDTIALDPEADQTKAFVAGGDIEAQPASDANAGGSEEQVQHSAEGESARLTEHEGKHFWKRYAATGELTFTSAAFDSEDEAKADAATAGFEL